VRDGLRRKKIDLEAEIEFVQRQAKIEESKILEEALRTACTRYAELVRNEVAPLHLVIEAGASLLAPIKGSLMDFHAWRGVRFVAPPFQDVKDLVPGDYSIPDLLASFTSGAGLSGAKDAWRRAVKAACGVSSL